MSEVLTFKGILKGKIKFYKGLPKWLIKFWVVLFSFSCMMTSLVVYATSDLQADVAPLTGFDYFDSMYQRYMIENNPDLLSDIMDPVNSTVFFFIKLETQILGILLLFLLVTSVTFSVWYALRPDFAEEVSEIKQMVASGQQIPVTDVKAFILQFCPDIIANSGLAGEYEYERPTLGLLLRDHLLKFTCAFAIAIALMGNILPTFVVKLGTAIAYAGKYYTDNTDFKGIVNTITTAGKDYKPRFDELTIEGKNQAKVFNALYVALKDQKPRDRTEDFLQRIGSQAHNWTLKLGDGTYPINYSFKNFVAHADVMPYDVEVPAVSNSAVKVVVKLKLTQLGMVVGMDIPQDEYVYLTVMQYNETPGSATVSNITEDPNGWTVSNGVPTSYDYSISNSSYLNGNEGYQFRGTLNSYTVAIETNLGSASKIVSANRQVSGKNFKIELSSTINELKSQISSKNKNENIVINRVTFTLDGNVELSKEVTQNNKKTYQAVTSAVPRTRTWVRTK